MSDYGADAEPDMAKTYDLTTTKSMLKHKCNVMQWTYPDRVVRKLARRQDHSNCLFKVED